MRKFDDVTEATPMQLLQEATEMYYFVACNNDRRVCSQSMSDEPASTPYDHAALLVKSVAAIAYASTGVDVDWWWENVFPDNMPDTVSVEQVESFWIGHQLGDDNLEPTVEHRLRTRLAELEGCKHYA